MSQLPYFQTGDPILSMLQTKWRALLNPLLAVSLTQGANLIGIKLVIGSNVINHKLGRTMQGWLITDIQTSSTITRTSPFNDKTLTLTSTSVLTINLWVF